MVEDRKQYLSKWEKMKEQISHSSEKLKQIYEISPQIRKSILETRAKKLAQKIKIPVHVPSLDIIEFRLDEERYGLECKYVREVYPLKNLTPIPGTPQFVRGIISVRGEIVSVIDLKKFFELPEKGLTDLTRVIILKNNEMQFGILSEEVMGTLSVPVNEIQPPLPTLTGIRADYLKGIAKNRLVVLDANKLLSDKQIVVHQEVEL